MQEDAVLNSYIKLSLEKGAQNLVSIFCEKEVPRHALAHECATQNMAH